MATTSGTYAYTVNQTVQFGPGCTSTAIPKLLKRFGVSKALIVCGNSLATKTDVISKIKKILGSSHAGTFTDIGQHAPFSGVQKGLEEYEKTGADCIISVGGGSPIDATKAMSYYAHEKTQKFITHIAIPTTLSAAEFSPMAGFTKDGKKTGVSDPGLSPTAVILDAEHSLETPMRLWLTTGLRAMDHAIETLYRPYAPPFIRTLAYSAIHALFENLPACQKNPDDLKVRQNLQLAAWHSLFPYRQEEDKKSALGLSHALGYAIGAPYSIAHGQCSCLSLGPTIRFKAHHQSSEMDRDNLAKILEVIGQSTTGSVIGDVEKVGDLVDGLVKELGYDQGMLELGVPDKEELNKICETAGLKGEEKDDMIKRLQSKL